MPVSSVSVGIVVAASGRICRATGRLRFVMSVWTDLADCVRRAYPLGTVDRWDPWTLETNAISLLRAELQSAVNLFVLFVPAVKFLEMVRALAVKKMLFCGVP